MPKEVRLCRTPRGTSGTRTRSKFCSEEPLCLEDAGERQESLHVVTPTPYPTLLEARWYAHHVPAMPHYSPLEYQPFIDWQSGAEGLPGREPGNVGESCHDQLRFLMNAWPLTVMAPLPVEAPAPMVTGSSSRRALQKKGQAVLEELAPPELQPLGDLLPRLLPTADLALAVATVCPLETNMATPRVAFCPDEPLCLEEAWPAAAGLHETALMTPTPVITSAFSSAPGAIRIVGY